MPETKKKSCAQTHQKGFHDDHRNIGRPRRFLPLGKSYTSISEAIEQLGPQISDPRLVSKSLGNMIKMISDRLCRDWTPEQAFGFEPPPLCAAKAEPRPIMCAGKLYPSETALAAAFNIPYKILAQRLHRDNWPAEAAVNLEPPPRLALVAEGLIGIIYMWRHRVTGKAYVGLTIDEPRRVWQHVAASKNGKAAAGTFQDAIAADGIDAFEFTILEDNIPGPQLPDRERFWIAKMGTLKPAGYNQNRGGVIGGFGGIIVIDGVTYLGYGRLAEAVGLPLGTIMGRIRMGWTVAEAAGLHERTPKTRCRIQMNLAGEELRFQTVAAACRYLGLSRALVSRYKHKTKQSWETAITTIFCQGILDSMEKFAIFPTYGRRRNLAA